MKFIAHRGASKECTENTVSALNKGAEIGAYAVECDLRLTKDDVFVIFHDDDLKRLAGQDKKIKDITYEEMKRILKENNIELSTFDDVLKGYKGDAYILLDFANIDDAKHYTLDDAFFEKLSKLPQKIICGVHQIEEAKCASKYFPRNQILAFMPNKEDYQEFYEAGAENIRLWEFWLEHITPSDVKKKCKNANVWIMSYRKDTGNDGCIESINELSELGADAILLNDIRLGIDWEKSR